MTGGRTNWTRLNGFDERIIALYARGRLPAMSAHPRGI
jgi:hypothetical protein